MKSRWNRIFSKISNPALKHRISRLEQEVEELQARNRRMAFQLEVLLARQQAEDEPSQRIA